MTLLCLCVPQQMQVTPFPAEVGEKVTVRVVAPHEVAGVAVEVATPDGRLLPCGSANAVGTVEFVPDAPGQYVYSTRLGAVRVVAPHRVVPARRTWWLAAACVPLGLALVWRNLSPARGRRDP